MTSLSNSITISPTASVSPSFLILPSQMGGETCDYSGEDWLWVTITILAILLLLSVIGNVFLLVRQIKTQKQKSITSIFEEDFEKEITHYDLS